MEVVEWVNLVQNLGLPIVLVGAMGWFIFLLWKQSAKREEKLYSELESSRLVNEKAIATIAIYAEKLDVIQKDVSDIKTDITTLISK